jgi:hypothetical protein
MRMMEDAAADFNPGVVTKFWRDAFVRYEPLGILVEPSAWRSSAARVAVNPENRTFIFSFSND